jgi:TIR domain
VRGLEDPAGSAACRRRRRPGVDFVQKIEDAVASCDALVAIIGNQWLTMTDEDGRRRLNDPKDWVRLEIAAALKRRILVLPVLVENAQMPSEAELPAPLRRLVRLNATELSDKRWDYEADQLTSVLKEAVASPAPEPTPRLPAPPSPPPLAPSAPARGRDERGSSSPLASADTQRTVTEARAVLAERQLVASPEPEAERPKTRRARPAAVVAGAVAAALLIGGLLALQFGRGTPGETAVIARTSTSLPEPATTIPPTPDPASASIDSTGQDRAPSARSGGRAAPDSGAGRTAGPAPTSPPITSQPPPATPPAPPIVVPPPAVPAGQLTIAPQSGRPGTVITLSAGACGRPADWTGGEIYFGLSDPQGNDAATGERWWTGAEPWQSQLTVPALPPGQYWVWANCFASNPSTGWEMFHLYPSASFNVG